MNDRDFTNDLLSTEKYMTNSYSTFLNEASHEALYQDVLQFLRKHKTNSANCTTLCSKKAGINLNQQINKNYSKNISNSKIIQLPNFHMAGKTSSNYMKKAALTIRVNAACHFYFVITCSRHVQILITG